MFTIHTTPFATNYFVSNSGDNSNSGTSLQNAFETIQTATDIVSDGDTVFVAEGEYVGFDHRESNGTESAPIVYKALSSDVVITTHGPKRNDGINIENANYIIIDGFTSNDMTGNGCGIRVVLANNCIVRNCKCDNNAERGIFTGFTDDILIEKNICTNSVDEHGIYVSNSSDRPIIRYNECYGNTRCGIHINGDQSQDGDGIISNAQIYGNTIYDNNLGAGINLDGADAPVIYNNLIYNNHASQGIVMFQEDGAIVSKGAKIYNNTIIVPTDGRWGILVKDGGNINTQIYNNIIINNHSFRGCIGVNATTDFSSDYNIVNDKMSNDGDESTISLSEWQQLGLGTHSLIADELSDIFVKQEDGDYSLKSQSQAIDAGTDLVKDIVKNDIADINRPIGAKFDIGAFEYAMTSTLPSSNSYKNRNGIKTDYNPIAKSLTVKLTNSDTSIKKISIIDAFGRTVHAAESTNKLDLKNLSSGIYFINIKLKNNSFVNDKFIIR